MLPKFQSFLKTAGQAWGRTTVVCYFAFLRRRAKTFELSVSGVEHLMDLGKRPYILIANHNFPGKSELWPMAYVPFLRPYHNSTDSFVFHRIIEEQTQRTLQTVTIGGNVFWSKIAWQNWMQRNVTQVFMRAAMNCLPDSIIIEKVPGAPQRQVLMGLQAAVERGDPIVIFPQTTSWQMTTEPRHFGALAAHAAIKFKLPILPASIINSESWKPGSRVNVAFGKAFGAEGMGKDELNAVMLERVKALYAQYA
jgi:1-acyl-sn-glycerol-3-phosphate acyltransferase